MAGYNANINITVSGQNRLDYVLNSVEKINAIVSKLKPINILNPGAGAGGDAIRVAKKQLDDFARTIVNFKPEGIQKRAKELSTTLAGSAAQADSLAVALANVGLKSGGFKQQVAEVKNYALALDEARRNADRINSISQTVQRQARVENVASRFGVSPEQVEQRINNIRDIRNKRDKEAQVAAIRAQQRQEDFEIRLGRILERNAALEKQRARTKEAASNAIIGGAFPLLFGQGLGASIGGGLGGFAGGMAGGQFGFGLSLVGTAVGASLDQAVNSAKDFEKALRQGGDAAGYLEQQLGFIDPTIRSQIQNLQNSGQTAAAAKLAFEQLAKAVGQEGAEAFLEQGKASNDLDVSLKKVINSFIAAGFAANKYFKELKYGPGGSFTDLLPEQFRPEPRPESPAVTGAFTQRTQQLQRDADILREQVKLTSVSARTDLDRFVVISKTVAQKEYENELSQISIQLKNREIDIEQNKQLITAANLKLSTKLGDIERTRVQEVQRRQDEQRQAAERAAREAEQARKRQIDLAKTLLQLENQVSEAYLEQADIQVQIDTFVNGEAAAVKEQLRVLDGVNAVKSGILENDRRAALLAADNAEQQDLITQYYDRQVDILQRQSYLDKERLQRRTNELILEERLQRIRAQQSKNAAVIPLRQQRDKVALDTAAFTTDPRLVEQQVLYLDQVRRAYEAELPVLQEIDVLTTEINANTLNTKALELKKQELADQQDKLAAIREELELLDAVEQKQLQLEQIYTRYGQVITAVSDGIADSVTNGVANIINGTQSAEEVFAQFLNNVAQALLDTAKDMIAQYIAIGIARIFAGLGGGGGGGNAATAMGSNPNVAAYAPLPSFAEGGFVTGPTNAIIGEGGESEYVIPASKMSAAMQRYGSGARGSAVIPTSGGSSTEPASTGAAPGGAIDVRYTVERINSVDYVTADQFQQGMQQAAIQGAQRGEQMVLRKLQQSPSTRRRVGVG